MRGKAVAALSALLCSLCCASCGSCPDPSNPPPIQDGAYVRQVGHSGDLYGDAAASSPYGKEDARELVIDRANNTAIIRYQRNGKSIEEHWDISEFYALTAQ